MKNTLKWQNISQFTGPSNYNAFKMTAVSVLVSMFRKMGLPNLRPLRQQLFSSAGTSNPWNREAQKLITL